MKLRPPHFHVSDTSRVVVRLDAILVLVVSVAVITWQIIY